MDMTGGLSASSSDKWASSLRNFLAMEDLSLSVLLIFAITFTQGIYTYEPETIHISRVAYVMLQLSVTATYCAYR
jgi:hypothetical protein